MSTSLPLSPENKDAMATCIDHDHMSDTQHPPQMQAIANPKSQLHETQQAASEQTGEPNVEEIQQVADEGRGEPSNEHTSLRPRTQSGEKSHSNTGNMEEAIREIQPRSTTAGSQVGDMTEDASKAELHKDPHTLQGNEGAGEAEESQHSEASYESHDNAMSVSDLTDDSSTTDPSTFGDDIDNFSDYESAGSASYHTSLLSFATDYYWENGRRYHAHQGGRYPLPNDETELDREDMKHHEWMLITDFRHHLAPIGANPQKILDIGTGTGIWAMQVADLYPSATVIGTDISPVQPRWVPPNLSFEVDDLDEEWLYRPDSHDLVNVRFMFLAIKDWPKMLAQAYKTLRPGGYIELSELTIDPKVTNPDCPQPAVIMRWLELLSGAMEKVGLNMRIAYGFKDLLTNAGFVDVVETRFEIPWGTWPRERREKVIGFWHLAQLKQGLQGIIMKLFGEIHGWSPEQIELFLVPLRKELDDKNFHLLDHGYVVYGRKP